MAPEQLFRPLDVDHRADIYSLGVVFYELLTGELPLGRFDPPSHKIHLDVRLDEIVLKALQREPERRYQQASHIKTEIDAVHLAPAAEKPAPPSIVPDNVLRRSAAFASFFLITVAQLALLGLTWGYLSDAEWYFKKDVPHNVLQGFWFGPGAAALGWLAWWWYLLAKDPGSPRGLNEFLRVWQTPHPQNRAIGLAMFSFLILWLGAIGAAFAFTSSDDIHTIVFTSGFLLGPYVLWTALWLRHRSLADSDALTAPTFDREMTGYDRRAGQERADWDTAARERAGGASRPDVDSPHGDVIGKDAPLSRKAVVGAVLILPFLFACGAVAIEYLTTTSTLQPVLVASPLAAMACLLGGLAVRDIRRSRTWGLPLAAFDALVLPLALIDALMIFFALMVASVAVDLLVGPPETSEIVNAPAVAEFEAARNERQHILTAHRDRVERLTKNLAGMIALPLCFLLDLVIARRVWRSLAPSHSRSRNVRKGDDDPFRLLAGPAHGLMAGGAVLILSAILSVTLLYQKFFALDASLEAIKHHDAIEFGFLFAQALTVPVAIIAFLAAAGMKQGQMRGLSLIASCLMLTPLTPGWLITLPLGAWSLAVLCKPEVRRAFRKDFPPGDKKRRQEIDDQASLSRKAVVGAVLILPFLFACWAVAIESLTTAGFGGVYPTVFMTSPLAAIACWLGGLAVRDIHRGRTWGLPLAAFDLLVLPLAIFNAAIIFFALMVASTGVDLSIAPPQVPSHIVEMEFSQEAPRQQRLDAINARLKIESAHAERVERRIKNLAGMIALPLCLILNYLVASRVWRSLAFQLGNTSSSVL
jgi:hypothetical protein